MKIDFEHFVKIERILRVRSGGGAALLYVVPFIFIFFQILLLCSIRAAARALCEPIGID